MKTTEWLKPAGIAGIAAARPIEYDFAAVSVACGKILCESSVDQTTVLPGDVKLVRNIRLQAPIRMQRARASHGAP